MRPAMMFIIGGLGLLLCCSYVVLPLLSVVSAANRQLARANALLEPLMQAMDKKGCAEDIPHCIRDFLAHEPAGAPFLHALQAAYVMAVQEVAQRVMLVGPDGRSVSTVFDVSTGQEFSFIWQRIETTYPVEHKLVVDVGAMNGVTGSNSYNFLQMGWRGVLVEPQLQHFGHMRMYDQRFLGLGTHIDFVHAAISDKDGMAQMCCFERDNSNTSCTLEIEGDCEKKAAPTAKVTSKFNVPVLTAASLVKNHHIPCGAGESFGVLSVDGEGVSEMVLRDMINIGCRPRFVIFEVAPNDPDAGILSPLGYNLVARTSSSRNRLDVFRNNIWELSQ